MRTTGNASTKLSLSVFDKQIVPILLYGSNIWSLPATQNLVYIAGQSEKANTRSLVDEIMHTVCGRSIPFAYARRVGKLGNYPRKILIRLNNYHDKEDLLRRASNHPYLFEEFNEHTTSDIEKVHTDYLKRCLNLNKHGSNTAVRGELGRFPVLHIAWSQTIKYWLRLQAGTQNQVLNAAFAQATYENHQWVQSIEALLKRNGFTNIWLNPGIADSEFHKYFKCRLDDQFKQDWSAKINSSRFEVLKCFKTNFVRSKYLDIIRCPDIRQIFTRLRVDMNVLATSKVNVSVSNTCPVCTRVEHVTHFILECPYFKQDRDKFVSEIRHVSPNFI